MCISGSESWLLTRTQSYWIRVHTHSNVTSFQLTTAARTLFLSRVSFRGDEGQELSMGIWMLNGGRTVQPPTAALESLRGVCLFCDLMDHNPLGSSVHEIVQARMLEGGNTLPSPWDLPHIGMEPTFPPL